MEEDEVVNCRCHHPEGDGMMVQVFKWSNGREHWEYNYLLQCEVCLTWQHGACIGVDSEEQVGNICVCICVWHWCAGEKLFTCVCFDWKPQTMLLYLSAEFCTIFSGSDCQVPENYTCSICRDPPLGRQSALYSIHHEWIRFDSKLEHHQVWRILTFDLFLGRGACLALPPVCPRMPPSNSCQGWHHNWELFWHFWRISVLKKSESCE